MLLGRLTCDTVLDAAYHWLCRRRRDYPDHANVWAFRRNWNEEKRTLVDDLRSGRFRFGLGTGVLRGCWY